MEVLCCAVFLDAVLGDPKNFPHPVVLIGRVIDFWHKRLFTGPRSFRRGLLLCVITLLTAGVSVQLLLLITGGNVLVKIYLLYSALAWRDLKDETAPVLEGLMNHNLTQARAYLSRVVGRDTQSLSEAETARATIETIAENSIDGVMSVLFFAGLGQILNPSWGMCVLVWVFKAASTLDSMVGYEAMGSYGAPSARLDDAMNFIPARLGGLVIVLAGGRGLEVFMSDRLKHKSPNSAHGESAFAGVLGVRLGGGAYYGGKFEAREWLNAAGREAGAFDIVRAWRVLDVSCSVFVVLVVVLTWIV